jgi:hypothetical protein
MTRLTARVFAEGAAPSGHGKGQFRNTSAIRAEVGIATIDFRTAPLSGFQPMLIYGAGAKRRILSTRSP